MCDPTPGCRKMTKKTLGQCLKNKNVAFKTRMKKAELCDLLLDVLDETSETSETKTTLDWEDSVSFKEIDLKLREGNWQLKIEPSLMPGFSVFSITNGTIDMNFNRVDKFQVNVRDLISETVARITFFRKNTKVGSLSLAFDPQDGTGSLSISSNLPKPNQNSWQVLSSVNVTAKDTKSLEKIFSQLHSL